MNRAVPMSPNSERLNEKSALVWIRRDLRVQDHAALSAALTYAKKVWVCFIFDETILEPLRQDGLRHDRRVEFIRHALEQVDANLREHGGGLINRRGRPESEIPALARKLGVDIVVTNHDYEPQAAARDATVASQLAEHRIDFLTLKDQVIFEKDEIRAANGNFYTVFTPYKRAWLKALASGDFAERVTLATNPRVLAPVPKELIEVLPTLDSLGFAPTDLIELGMPLGEKGANSLLDEFVTRIDDYRSRRDFPAIRGPSYLSVHLRFGTISIRALVRRCMARLKVLESDDTSGAATWLSELVWRDFFTQVLYHRPDLEEHAFRREYDQLEWVEGPLEQRYLKAWIDGLTGYPIVDAAMRQIAGTGYMHNRLRMVTANFLVKDLGVNWRRGEAYFAAMLNDFDLASNNGNWQWAASTGCDAQPYFRIFNPTLQSQRFDANGKFIRQWLPELADVPDKFIHEPWTAPNEVAQRIAGRYPPPIVDHAQARGETLARYQKAERE